MNRATAPLYWRADSVNHWGAAMNKREFLKSLLGAAGMGLTSLAAGRIARLAHRESGGQNDSQAVGLGSGEIARQSEGGPHSGQAGQRGGAQVGGQAGAQRGGEIARQHGGGESRSAVGGDAGRLLIQVSPLAGFQFYAGEKLWPRLQPGDRLDLRRAPGNEYDERAVEVRWKGRMLGHIPRRDNASVSQMLDRGESLHAVIAAKKKAPSPWQRIKLEVWRAPAQTPA